jgi:hypothetical protein
MCLKIEIIITKVQKTYRNFGKIHKDNSPAVIYFDGSLYWYQYGKFQYYTSRKKYEL